VRQKSDAQLLNRDSAAPMSKVQNGEESSTCVRVSYAADSEIQPAQFHGHFSKFGKVKGVMMIKKKGEEGKVARV
jgi:hypothetical protein